MFIDDSIPKNYKYIADISDNYIVLVKEPYLSSNKTYEAYYQFFNPSTQTLYVPSYTICNGNKVFLDNIYYDTDSNGNIYFTNLEFGYGKDLPTLEFASGDNNTNFYNRPDLPLVLVSTGFFLSLFILIVSLATSLIHRGGIFHA